MKKRVKNFFSDFKKFISKGNIMDLAVAVIIGGAFGKIVSSLVNDIIMPLVTGAIGVNSIAELSWVIKDAVVENGEIVRPALMVKWGNFLQNIIDFLIIAFFVFLIIRTLTMAKNVAGKLAEEAREAAEKIAAEAKEMISRRHDAAEGAEGETVLVSAPIADTPSQAQDAAEGEPKIVTENNESAESLLREIRDLLKAK